ncbi:NRDE family protein [Sungkyunkwania multivorans]|uniref:NRDE family protein n=1 Tax=Sungkyunkwania multivorans TaxID=1173618 RepID=A0ABW3CY26_9FLAO
MCTVTFIPTKKNDFILTSNRDESPMRTSLPPDFYKIEDVEVLFPKDELSGGSWIGITELNRMVCLLNGANKDHKRKLPYRMSRGEVVKSALTSNDIERHLEDLDLSGIEPFTLIVLDWNKELTLSELVWDANHRHLSRLPLSPRIWSSSTLYTDEMKVMRKQWFEAFKFKNILSAENIWRFHHEAGIGDKNTDVVLDRGFVKTTSITQVEKKDRAVQMTFEDVRTNAITSKTFELENV